MVCNAFLIIKLFVLLGDEPCIIYKKYKKINGLFMLLKYNIDHISDPLLSQLNNMYTTKHKSYNTTQVTKTT